MILLFGKHKELARAISGIALLAVGIVLHQEILAVVGGVLLAWGALRIAAARRC